MQPAGFLDRDGTMNVDVGYLDTLERFLLFPWTLDAVRLLRSSGYYVVVVTNQSGVARGMVDGTFVEEVHQLMEDELAMVGSQLDGLYYCPHESDALVREYRMECDCQKPKSGLIDRAVADLDIDVPRSFVVGDKWSDIGLAQNVGARGVLVRTGYGRSQEQHPVDGLVPEAVVDTLMDAASWIIRHP